MKRRSPSSINIWPGFVDAISTLLLVFVFLLALFMVSQTFLTQVLSGKNIALESLKNQLFKLDKDLEDNKLQKAKLSDLLSDLNKELEKLNIDKQKTEKDYLQEKDLNKKYKLNLRELESKVQSLFDQFGLEKLSLESERKINKELSADLVTLNTNVKQLNKKLLDLQNALSLSMGQVKDKEIEVESLNNKLDLALSKKIGELTEYRSEFFGKLKSIIGDEKEIIIVGDRFVLQSEILFKSGSASLEKKGTIKIVEITNILKSITAKIPSNIDWLLQVEGHTDNVPISNLVHPSNWELSTARAISVAKIMIKNGIESKKINVAGYGEHRPLFPNNTSKNREKNRRIELKLTQP